MAARSDHEHLMTLISDGTVTFADGITYLSRPSPGRLLLAPSCATRALKVSLARKVG